MTENTQDQPVILVVDDNDDIRDMVVEHLRQRQCKVEFATNGEEGLEKVLQIQPDLVLLDVMMPVLNGWELAKYIREKPEFDTMGVIMVTAIGDAVNEMTSELYGADDHINKPFQLSELDFKIRKVLAQKRNSNDEA